MLDSILSMQTWRALRLLQAIALAIAFSLVPLSALAGEADTLSPLPAASTAARGAAAGDRLLDCVNAPAAARLCCSEPAAGAQPLASVGLRDADEEPALAFQSVIFPARGIPAQRTAPFARGPGLALSRFILFGNFRS